MERDHEVTVALARSRLALWERAGADGNTRVPVTVECLPDNSQHLESSRPRSCSYAFYEWLREREHEFDIVQLPESRGTGYYALNAKRQGIAFRKLRFVVACHGPAAFFRPHLPRLAHLDDADLLEQDFMERRTVERADVIVSPSASLLGWMRSRGWVLPPWTRLHPYLLRPAVALDASVVPWTALYDTLSCLPDDAEEETGDRPQPLVSVCLTHYNRPGLLRQALASIYSQDYPNLEVVLVDDASTAADVPPLLDRLERDFGRRGWRIVRHHENRGSGGSRNTAAAHARGELLLLMDDDNYAKPGEVSTLVDVSSRTGADIVTSACDVFSHFDAPSGDEPPRRWIPLGPALAAGVFRNCFGDTNSLVRRDSFCRVNGYERDPSVGFPDWEFYARAVLAGLEVEVVPEPLYWYRSLPGTMVDTADRTLGHQSVLRTYETNGDPELNELVVAAEQCLRSSRTPLPDQGAPT